MNFWKKWKNKKELREKLEKARFVNFYGNQIDLSLGRIIKATPDNEITTVISDFRDDYKIKNYSIVLKLYLAINPKASPVFSRLYLVFKSPK